MTMPITGASGASAPPGNLPAPYHSSVQHFEDNRYDPDLGDVAGSSDPLPPGVALDALVDAVVERIERRVVDELERRGRTQSWGAF